MEGRIENENKIKNSTYKKLQDKPDYLIEFYYYLLASKKTAHTVDDYINKVIMFLKYHDYNIENISRSSTMKYYISIQTKENGKNTSDSYQRSVWYALNNFFEYMVLTNSIKENYMKSIQIPKDNDLERINKNRILLTELDFVAILRAVESSPERHGYKKRDYAIILLFMTTGMRETALISINENDIDFENKKLLVVDKGRREFEYSLQPGVIDAINKWLEIKHNYTDNNALFTNPSGNRLGTKGVSNIIKKYTNIVLPKGVSPHKLRSGFCSILYSETHDIEYVRKAVGHRRLTTTQRYIVTENDEMKKASETIAKKIGIGG